MAFHIAISQEEIENLGVFRTNGPAHFVWPDSQLFQLAELTIVLGFALMEKQDRLAGFASWGLVKNIPDFAGLWHARYDRPDGVLRLDIPRGPGELLLPLGLGRLATARILALPALRGAGGWFILIFLVIDIDPRSVVFVIVVFRFHRQDTEPVLAARTDVGRVGGQDGCPNMLAGRMFVIVGAGAADGQLLAAEFPVQDHFVLGPALDVCPEFTWPTFAGGYPAFTKVLLSAAANGATELVDTTIGQRHGRTSVPWAGLLIPRRVMGA